MATNQSALCLNRGLSSDFWWLRNANHVKFTEVCMQHVLVFFLKMSSNGLNLGFPV